MYSYVVYSIVNGRVLVLVWCREPGRVADGRGARLVRGAARLALRLDPHGRDERGLLVCDAILAPSSCAALVNSGTLRSDELLPAGPFRRRHLSRLIPTDPLELAVIAITGERLLAALESAVSVWPKHEGRFPQVAGVTFEFFGDAPPGARVRRASVRVADQPLQLDRVRTAPALLIAL